MNWHDIYTKYKDAERMNELKELYVKIKHPRLYKSGVKTMAIDHLTIQDVFGYILCLAETKEGMVSRLMVQFAFDINIAEKPLTIKQSMLKCAKLFFVL